MKNLKSSIIELRKSGKTINEIKGILGCAKSTISFHLKNNDLGGSIKKGGSKKYTTEDFLKSVSDEEIERIIDLRNNRKTYKEILEEVSISKDKLIKVCNIFKLNKCSNSLTQEKIDEIKKHTNKLKV